MKESVNEYIDASLFLGMHNKDEQTRIACKNYFVERLDHKVGMSLEQVGKCDDVLWKNIPREKQDAYWPFMDNLHTVMNIERTPYTNEDIRGLLHPYLLGAHSDTQLDNSERLTLGMVLERRGVLYTVNPKLLNVRFESVLTRLGERVPVEVRDFIFFPERGPEQDFPDELERLYQQSLVVRI